MILSCINVEEIAKWHWPSSSFLLWGQSQPNQARGQGAPRLPSAFSWANALRASSQVVKCPARTIKMGTRDPSNLKLLVKVLFQHHAPLHFSTLDSQVKLVSFLLHLLLLTTNCTPNTCQAQYSITFPLKINFQYFFPPILGLITFVYLI